MSDHTETKIVNGHELKDCIRRLFEDHAPNIAVAFWGEGATEGLGLDKSPKGRIVCNLATGGTNPKEIEKLLQFHDVRHCDTLHYKVYLGARTAIVGSSNASANGLSLQGASCDGWIETNIVTGSRNIRAELADWFDNLWQDEEIREITTEDLQKAYKVWSSRRRSGFRVKKIEGDLVRRILHHPEDFSATRLFVTLYREGEVSAAAQNALEHENKNNSAGLELDCFENWDEIEPDADHICFHVGPRDGVRYDGIFTVPPGPLIRNIDENNSITLCWKTDSQHLTSEGSMHMKAAVKTWLKDNPLDGALCIPIEEFIQALRKSRDAYT